MAFVLLALALIDETICRVDMTQVPKNGYLFNHRSSIPKQRVVFGFKPIWLRILSDQFDHACFKCNRTDCKCACNGDYLHWSSSAERRSLLRCEFLQLNAAYALAVVMTDACIIRRRMAANILRNIYGY